MDASAHASHQHILNTMSVEDPEDAIRVELSVRSNRTHAQAYDPRAALTDRRKSRTLSAVSSGSPESVVGTSSDVGNSLHTRSTALSQCLAEDAPFTVTMLPLPPRIEASPASPRVEQTRGGVAPIGHPAPLRTIVDIDLANFDEVWAAGEHPHYVFPTTFEERVRISAGTPADVGA